MKIEKHGAKFRVRKMYKGVVYVVDFDHEPDDKELLIAVAKKIEEESGTKGSFESYAKKYIENRRNVVSPNTIRTYNTKINQLSEGFKKKNIYDIESEEIQAEVNRLSEKLEPKTVKTTYGFITAVLGANRSLGKLRVKLPQTIKKEVYEPTNKDIKRILDEVKGTNYSVAFQLGVWGCREGEICALDIEDLDKNNNLHIHRTMVMDENCKWMVKETPKTDESNRTIPLPKELADEIREQGFIFDKIPNRLNKKIHDVQKKLGIPSFKFHALRSYFASYAHSLGIPDSDILSLGGWKTDNVMKRVYRKSIEESKEKSAKILAKALYKRNSKKG